MSRATLYVGDALEVLRTLPDESVQCCVCSPPYWGLRDYGTGTWEGGDPECDHRSPTMREGRNEDRPKLAGSDATNAAQLRLAHHSGCGKCGAVKVDLQLGLESTPEEYVANLVEVFREVRRVLRDDATLWLNLGDSYTTGMSTSSRASDPKAVGNVSCGLRRIGTPDGLKPKDLVGIPWLVAKALQRPYYMGRIDREVDRSWLAAIIDGEGTICGIRHRRKDDGRVRTMASVFVTNSCTAMLDRCGEIWRAPRYDHITNSEGHLGVREMFRWTVQGADEKSALLAELYPYFVSKKIQALLAWNLLEFIKDGRRLGKSKQAQEVRDKRDILVSCISTLNQGGSVDVPTWCNEPPGLYEDGWYLRSDIIWSKPNPMPESVTDRPTKSHEYVFLFSKKQRYFYDADAIAEDVVRGDAGSSSYTSGKTAMHQLGRAGTAPRKESRPRTQGKHSTQPLQSSGHRIVENVARARAEGADHDSPFGHTRNARSVWEIATKPFTGWTRTAHRVRVEPGDADDDTTRTESPCCPVHGDPAVLAANLACGEHATDGKNRTAHNGVDLGQGQSRVPAPTGRTDGEDCADGSSGFSHPGYVDAAKPHSKRSHKTAHAPETISPSTASAQKTDHTDGTLGSPANGEQSGHRIENSKDVDGSDARLLAQRVDHIADKISSGGLQCTCSYHKVIYKNTSHYAVMPAELASRCIKAGSKPTDTVLDPFGGSGTTASVATGLGRNAIHIDLNPDLSLAIDRIGPLLVDVKEVAA